MLRGSSTQTMNPGGKSAAMYSTQQVSDMLKQESREKEKLLTSNYQLQRKQVLDQYKKDLGEPTAPGNGMNPAYNNNPSTQPPQSARLVRHEDYHLKNKQSESTKVLGKFGGGNVQEGMLSPQSMSNAVQQNNGRSRKQNMDNFMQATAFETKRASRKLVQIEDDDVYQEGIIGVDGAYEGLLYSQSLEFYEKQYREKLKALEQEKQAR